MKVHTDTIGLIPIINQIVAYFRIAQFAPLIIYRHLPLYLKFAMQHFK